MIDTAHLLQELKTASKMLFVSHEKENLAAAALYKQLLVQPDDLFALQSTTLRAQQIKLFYEAISSYRVFGIDGSQIYPDRHEGWACGLLHAGLVDISYGATSTILFHTQQKLVLSDEQYGGSEFIDARRQELELAAAVAYTAEHKPDLLLVDGSLLYWHLESFSEVVREEFLGKYLQHCYALYLQKVPVIGYTSLPNSKDIIDLLNAYAQKIAQDERPTEFNAIRDRDCLAYALEPGEFSPLFELVDDQVAVYPAMLKPYVIYYHAGSEIARLELPAWLVENKKLFQQALSIVHDQTHKGDGYPLALAEAHELTVIKAPDRNYFYRLLSLHAQRESLAIPRRSIKLEKKQRMRV